jgi:hypothetical protein
MSSHSILEAQHYATTAASQDFHCKLELYISPRSMDSQHYEATAEIGDFPSTLLNDMAPWIAFNT